MFNRCLDVLASSGRSEFLDGNESVRVVSTWEQ